MINRALTITGNNKELVVFRDVMSDDIGISCDDLVLRG
jgi:hypothetical protein